MDVLLRRLCIRHRLALWLLRGDGMLANLIVQPTDGWLEFHKRHPDQMTTVAGITYLGVGTEQMPSATFVVGLGSQ